MIERKESILKEIQCMGGILSHETDEGDPIKAQVRATMMLATILARIHEELHIIAECLIEKRDI